MHYARKTSADIICTNHYENIQTKYKSKSVNDLTDVTYIDIGSCVNVSIDRADSVGDLTDNIYENVEESCSLTRHKVSCYGLNY